MQKAAEGTIRACNGTAARDTTRAPFRTAIMITYIPILPTTIGPRKATSKSAATTRAANHEVRSILSSDRSPIT